MSTTHSPPVHPAKIEMQQEGSLRRMHKKQVELQLRFWSFAKSVQHQHLLETLTKLLGIPEDEVRMIMNAPTYPPSTDYAGPTLDLKRLRAVLGIENGNSRGPISKSRPDTTNLLAFATGANTLLPSSIVTFSRPPPQNSNSSVGIFNGGSLAAATQCGRIPSITADLATQVFQANSIVVSHHVLAQLQVWQRLLGWEAKPSSGGSIPVVSNKPAAASAIKEEGGGWSSSGAKVKKTLSRVLVTAPPCEIEYRDQPTPKGLSVLRLAHEVFVMPGIAALQQSGGPNSVVSPHMLDSLLALGLGSSSVSTSSSQTPPSSGFGVPPPNNYPAISLGSSSISTSSSQSPPSPTLGVQRFASPSSPIPAPPSILPLITPQVVLWNLPTQPWSKAFLREFDILMINHDGIGASGEHSILKKRIELMVKWADDSMKRSGINDEEPGSDSSSKSSSPSSPSSSPESGQRNGSIPRSRGGGTSQEELKPLPPPPSLGLFAVTCAVYALGALSYGSKSIHGRFPEDGEGISPLPTTAPSAPLNPHMHPLPDKATPANLLNLARAAMLVHDESALPPSLDYLHAHMLTWLYLLHPSDSASSVTSSGFQGSSTGVGSGGMTVVEQTIYKELGKCVCVARAMGLDLVDRRRGKPRGGTFGVGAVKDPDDGVEEMGIWEKEMRRRVWWQLMMFDQQISDNLGRPPLIPPGTYACRPPSEADESVFSPTATKIPKLRERSIGFNTTYFATKCRLLAIIKTLPYAQHEEGVTLDLARQLDAQVSRWRSSLPAQYEIDFRGESEHTLFPDLDTVDVQACDLHIMANVFLLRLWLPFFNDALSSSSPSSQGVLLTATTAAYAVVVASHHLVTRFRAARPMSFGHYDFGNSVWLATGVLASVATMKSDVLFSATAIRGVEMAAAVFRNQVVEGKSDSNHVPKNEVNNIMRHIERLVAQVRKGKGSSESGLWSAVDVNDTQDSIPIPYVGTAATTTPTNISFLPTQHDPPPESAFGTPRNLSDQDVDETSSDSALLTPHTSDVGSDLASDSGRPMGEVFAAPLAFAAEVPRSRTSGLASRMSSSQTIISQGKVRPVIGIRRRLPLTAAHPPSSASPVHVSPNSNRSRTRAPASGLSFVQKSSSSHYTHNLSHSLSSSEPLAHLATPPPKPPFSVHQSSPPSSISLQGCPSQNVQHVHDSSLNITIGTRLTPVWFSQPPPAVPPDTYLNPMSQGHLSPTSMLDSSCIQVPSSSNRAVNGIDLYPQATLPQSCSSSASTLPQAVLSTASPKVDAGIAELHGTGGPSVSHQPESYGPAAGVSHWSRQYNVGGFDVRPLSVDKPLDMRTAHSSYLPPAIPQQYTSHPRIYPSQDFSVDPFSELTWDNVPDP
ncbi:hypothetical protein FS837_004130 [Tulasnella sp. UAMH 9824]|nr:hypothetical protein FS837_004130 [Tulasnella sp. UAMH 9824]